jgi:outer membrane lipoprotein-sorting protein
VTVNSLDAQTVSNSETLIWVDETLGIPIKSVTTSNGGIRTMELSDVSFEVDKGLFLIPPDYQKIDVRSLRQRLR